MKSAKHVGKGRRESSTQKTPNGPSKFPCLENRLKRLEALASRTLAHDAGRFGFYEYLEKVFARVVLWRQSRKLKKRLMQIRALRPHAASRSANPFFTVLAATSPSDVKWRSKWAKFLAEAEAAGIDRGRLRHFSQNGKRSGPKTKPLAGNTFESNVWE
jgi:hypothetical protein